MGPLVGSVEAGGTKFVCAVGTGPDDLRGEERFPTTTPGETLDRVLAYFRAQVERHSPLAAVGVGCFGPVDLDAGSSTYGHVTSTPKPGWSGANVVGPLAAGLGVPVGFDTDVNAAALGEGRWGAARGLDTFLYLTVGTGIGGGSVVHGQPLHGLIHPEMGHVRVIRDPARDPFAGRCPYHGDCLEGLAAGPALEDRWGQAAETLPADHEAWGLEADYLGQALADLVLVLSPQRIILGGGVMEQAHLLPMIRGRVAALLAGYVRAPAILERIDDFIVAPALGHRAGILGGVALGQSILTAAERPRRGRT